jgi:hypothetical protein
MAIDFGGPTNTTRHYTIPNSASLAFPSGDWSFGMWLKIEQNAGSAYQYLLSANATGVGSQFLWRLGEASSAAGDANAFIWQAEDGDGTTFSHVSSPQTALFNGIPFLLIFQKSGTTAHIYACQEDGTASLIGSGSATAFGAGAAPGAWYVGARSNLDTTRFYAEHFGELWFANRALSLAEVTTLGSGTAPDIVLGANLLGWWQFTAANMTIPDDVGTVDATRVGTGWLTSTHFPTRAVGGQVFYIATAANGGSNANSGSSASPWLTFAHADAQIGPGDTVIVKPGTYQESEIILTTSGTSGARVTWRSEVKHGAIVQPVDNQPERTVILVRADYIDIDGFQIDGTPYPECNGGIELGQSHGRVYNCLVHHVRALGGETGQGGAGISLSGFWGPTGDYTATDNQAYNNIVHHIGAYPTPGEFTHGIYPASPIGKVYNNLIYAIEATGIHLWHNARTYEVTNNTIFECGDAGIIAAADVSIGSLIDSKFSNNIAIDCETGLIEEGAIGTGNEYRNNTFFSCITATSGTPTPISGTLTTDPGLVNYQANGSGNYHLASGSPSIDSGFATWAPAIDHDGIARPQGAGFDRGAFEFSGFAGTAAGTLSAATASAAGVVGGAPPPAASGIRLGVTSINGIGLGSAAINRVYVGTSLFWSD